MHTRPLLLARGVTRIAGSAVATLAVWTFAPLAIGWTPVVITSGSMEPGVRAGDIVVIEPIDATTTALDVGDVITYRQPGLERLVTHRIHTLAADGTYRTKGDANAQPDSDPLPPDAVEGRARLLVPYAGLAAADPTARMILLVGVVALLWRRLQPRPNDPQRPGSLATTSAAVSHGRRSRRRDETHGGARTPITPATVVVPRPSGPSTGAPAESIAVTGPVPWTAGVRQRRVATRRRRALEAGAVVSLAAIVVPIAATAAFTGSSPRGSEFTAHVVVPPSNLTATASCDAAAAPMVTVEWTSSVTSGVDGYVILRSDGGGPYNPIVTTGPSDTSIVDEAVAEGSYAYVARATEGTWTSQDGGPASVTVAPCP